MAVTFDLVDSSSISLMIYNKKVMSVDLEKISFLSENCADSIFSALSQNFVTAQVIVGEARDVDDEALNIGDKALRALDQVLEAVEEALDAVDEAPRVGGDLDAVVEAKDAVFEACNSVGEALGAADVVPRYSTRYNN